jgi:hypothetical protein
MGDRRRLRLPPFWEGRRAGLGIRPFWLATLLAIGIAIVSQSLLLPIVLAVAFWPAILAFVMEVRWASPAMWDYFDEIGFWGIPGIRDTITPVVLLFKRASAPDAERLRKIARRRFLLTFGVFLSTGLWWWFVGAVVFLVQGNR